MNMNRGTAALVFFAWLLGFLMATAVFALWPEPQEEEPIRTTLTDEQRARLIEGLEKLGDPHKEEREAFMKECMQEAIERADSLRKQGLHVDVGSDDVRVCGNRFKSMIEDRELREKYSPVTD